MLEKFQILTVERAEEEGFATYDGCDHVCLKLADKPVTLSVRCSNGKLVTFKFQHYEKLGGHHCVDVTYHGPNQLDGIPIQHCSVNGLGPTLYNTKRDATDDPATQVVVSLRDDI